MRMKHSRMGLKRYVTLKVFNWLETIVQWIQEALQKREHSLNAEVDAEAGNKSKAPETMTPRKGKNKGLSRSGKGGYARRSKKLG